MLLLDLLDANNLVKHLGKVGGRNKNQYIQNLIDPETQQWVLKNFLQTT